MSHPQDALLERIGQLEDELALFRELLPLVANTCGRGNCNCMGSNSIKGLIDRAGLGRIPVRGRK